MMSPLTHQEVCNLFTALGVVRVERVGAGWLIQTSADHRTVGAFLYTHGLLHRTGGQGTSEHCAVYYDQPGWCGKVPRSWLPAIAKKKQDYYRPSIVACREALINAGFTV